MARANENGFLMGCFRALTMTAALLTWSVASAQNEPPVIAETTAETAGASSASFSGASSIVGQFVSRLNYGYFNFSSARIDRLAERSARVDAYNYFNFDYRRANGHRISARPVFQWSTAGMDFRNEYKSGEFRVGDSYVNYIVPRAASFGITDVRADLRVYGPTSQESQKRGMITRLRPDLKFQNRIGRKWELIWHVEPDYYVQSRTGYLNDRGFARGNKNVGYETALELVHKFNRKLGVSVEAGHSQMWHHKVPIEGIHEIHRTEELTTQASMSFAAGPAFVVMGMSQKRDLIRPRSGYRLFNETESQVYCLNYWRF
jgi:hypothetical protein